MEKEEEEEGKGEEGGERVRIAKLEFLNPQRQITDWDIFIKVMLLCRIY